MLVVYIIGLTICSVLYSVIFQFAWCRCNVVDIQTSASLNMSFNCLSLHN